MTFKLILDTFSEALHALKRDDIEQAEALIHCANEALLALENELYNRANLRGEFHQNCFRTAFDLQALCSLSLEETILTGEGGDRHLYN